MGNAKGRCLRQRVMTKGFGGRAGARGGAWEVGRACEGQVEAKPERALVVTVHELDQGTCVLGQGHC